MLLRGNPHESNGLDNGMRHDAMKMHIGFFSGDITRSGGTENVSIIIANELANLSEYKVSFVSLFEERGMPFFAIDERIERFALYPEVVHGIQHYFDTCYRLKQMVKKQKIDLLIDIDGILDMYSLPVKHSTGIKVISWEHFNYLQNPDVPYRKLTRRWAAHSADAIVTLTKTDKSMYEENLNLRCPVTAIANPMKDPCDQVIYDADSRLILSSGRLTYQKGFDLLVDAAAQVLPQHPDWRWIVLGEGEDRPLLEQKIRDANLEGRLILMGRVKNVDDYYRKAGLFVMTSRFEGLPMVLLEAKTYRLPLVSFDCPTGPSEVIENGVNGTITAPENTHALASAVNELLDNREKRIAYSVNSGSNAKSYDKKHILCQWQELLNEVMQ